MKVQGGGRTPPKWSHHHYLVIVLYASSNIKQRQLFNCGHLWLYSVCLNNCAVCFCSLCGWVLNSSSLVVPEFLNSWNFVLQDIIQSMPHDAHPMGVLVSAMSALSVFHPDANPALRVSNIFNFSNFCIPLPFCYTATHEEVFEQYIFCRQSFYVLPVYRCFRCLLISFWIPEINLSSLFQN